MAHVANPVSVRTMSLSLSTLMWGALLLAAVSIGSRIAAVLPPVVEDPPIEVITMALPPLVKSEPVIRPTPTDPDEAAAVTHARDGKATHVILRIHDTRGVLDA